MKAALYARAFISEYWVLDVTRRRLIVHHEPQAGRRQFIAAYGEDESISPLGYPTASLRIGDVFPE